MIDKVGGPAFADMGNRIAYVAEAKGHPAASDWHYELRACEACIGLRPDGSPFDSRFQSSFIEFEERE